MPRPRGCRADAKELDHRLQVLVVVLGACHHPDLLAWVHLDVRQRLGDVRAELDATDEDL